MSSLAMYKIMNLPSPTDQFFNEFDSLIRMFLWKRKSSKIHLDKIKLSYNNGGLQLSDLKLKNSSLKITRIHRIMREGNSFLAKYTYSILPIHGMDF